MNNKKQQLKLSAPWYLVYWKIRKLFDQDSEINISELFEADSENYKLIISSENEAKINALERILKSKYEFGNVTLKIEFEYIERVNDDISVSDFRIAFAGNPILNKIESRTVDGIFDASYVIFERKIISYYADDLSSYFGWHNGLAEDFARDLFNEAPGIYFSTALR